MNKKIPRLYYGIMLLFLLGLTSCKKEVKQFEHFLEQVTYLFLVVFVIIYIIVAIGVVYQIIFFFSNFIFFTKKKNPSFQEIIDTNLLESNLVAEQYTTFFSKANYNYITWREMLGFAVQSIAYGVFFLLFFFIEIDFTAFIPLTRSMGLILTTLGGVFAIINIFIVHKLKYHPLYEQRIKKSNFSIEELLTRLKNNKGYFIQEEISTGNSLSLKIEPNKLLIATQPIYLLIELESKEANSYNYKIIRQYIRCGYATQQNSKKSFNLLLKQTF